MAILATGFALPNYAFADDPTDRVLQLLEDNSEGGTVGLYLKEVGGPVMAAHNENFVFEPASAIKALIHFHAMKQVQDGAVIDGDVVTLDRQIQWFTDQTGSCPDLTGEAFDTLEAGLSQMMGPSDNRWTQAMRDFFGDANINNTRQDFDMTNSALIHMIGCAGPALANPNQLTLVDAGKMYEAVATGFLDASTRETAYGLMDRQFGVVDSIIDEEAQGLGLSSAGIADFKAERDSALKKGDYDLNSLFYRSSAGWAKIPFKDASCDVSPREYVFGAFINGASSLAEGFSTRATSIDLLREQIRDALESWAECEADLEIVSFDASAIPDEVLIGESFQIDLTKTITNNGPASTADVDVDVVAAGTSGVSVDPSSAGQTVVGLDDGELGEVNESFMVTCNEPGVQEVTFTNTITPVERVDPDLSNNEDEVTIAIDCTILVQINIKPGGNPNSVNLNSKNGIIPVTILTTLAGEYGLTVDIDATTIDPLSVHFGPADALLNVEPAGGATESHSTGHLEDSFELDEATKDGDTDMVLHFKASESGLEQSDTEACIKGQINIGGTWYTFFGCDSMKVVP